MHNIHGIEEKNKNKFLLNKKEEKKTFSILPYETL